MRAPPCPLYMACNCCIRWWRCALTELAPAPDAGPPARRGRAWPAFTAPPSRRPLEVELEVEQAESGREGLRLGASDGGRGGAARGLGAPPGRARLSIVGRKRGALRNRLRMPSSSTSLANFLKAETSASMSPRSSAPAMLPLSQLRPAGRGPRCGLLCRARPSANSCHGPMYSGAALDKADAFSCSACLLWAATRLREEAVVQYDAALRVEAAEAVESPLTDGVAGLERLAARMAQQRQRRGRRDAERTSPRLSVRHHAFGLVGCGFCKDFCNVAD